MQYLIPLLLFISITIHAQSAELTGHVTNGETKEYLPGCNIIVEDNFEGTTTDSDGKYSLKLPKGKHRIKFSFVGFQTFYYEAKIDSSNKKIIVNVKLMPDAVLQKEITVNASRDYSSVSVQTIKAKEISKIPSLYGDVIRSIQILAGVSTNNELSSGYNVRGGTYDENLIYLNGYEIYRPFLLRQGIEENQSLINPMLVEDINFYNGSFPARFGDKTASVLEVNYLRKFDQPFQVFARVDLLNAGIGANGKAGNLNWSAAARIAYPSLFLQKLQTRGDYKPSYSDIQCLANYSLSNKDNIEIFLLNALNEYDLTPADWIGHFRTDRSTGFASQITLLYNGNRLNSYRTGLYALRYRRELKNNINLSVSAGRFTTSEIEKADISSRLYYSPDATNSELDKEFLFLRNEFADNRVNLVSNEIRSELKANYENHLLRVGAEIKLVKLTSNTNELYSENGPQAVITEPQVTSTHINCNLNSAAFYTEDNLLLTENMSANVGIRFLHNSFTREDLISPRIGLFYKINNASSLQLGWGYYYQPPFYNEINSFMNENIKLKSQLAIHYTLGWEHYFKPTMKINIEGYYKKLDNLIPFYYKDIKPVYLYGNINEGYAYGFDAMLQGELTDGIESRIGYSYLNSRERKKGSGEPYRRRILDQTHTIQIYFQDRFRKHRNWQSHLRFLVGSGFLYAPNKIVKDEVSGQSKLITDIEHPQEIFLYFRVDMGLSASFNIGKNSKIMFVAEVLNLFNHYNIGSYDWIMVFKDIQQVIAVPRVLSKRFFNFRVEFNL